MQLPSDRQNGEVGLPGGVVELHEDAKCRTGRCVACVAKHLKHRFPEKVSMQSSGNGAIGLARLALVAVMVVVVAMMAGTAMATAVATWPGR